MHLHPPRQILGTCHLPTADTKYCKGVTDLAFNKCREWWVEAIRGNCAQAQLQPKDDGRTCNARSMLWWAALRLPHDATRRDTHADALIPCLSVASWRWGCLTVSLAMPVNVPTYACVFAVDACALPNWLM
jgi:hypothetical protein